MKRWIVWMLALAALGGGGWWVSQRWPDAFARLAFWKDKPAAASKSARPTTAEVTTRDIDFAVTAAGDIGPADQVSVRPEISGRIATLPVDIGDEVKQNDILFTLDDRDLQIERSQRETEIEGARLQIEGSKLQVDKMQLLFERTKKLFEDRLVSKEVYENAKNDVDVTKNNLELAKNRLEVTQKALALVDDKLTRTKIRAPFNCTVLTRPVSVGQAVSGSSGVNSGTEVLTIANLNEMVIFAHVNQADVTRLRVGQKVDIEVEAVPGLKLQGEVDRIAPQATIKNGIKGFATRILLRNARSQVRPGMTANLTIPLLSAADVLAVPLAAVFTEQGERFVFVKQGEKFERRTIEIGVTDFDFAEVVNGLNGGETLSLVQPPEETGLATQAFAGGRERAGGSGKTSAGSRSADKAATAKTNGGKSGGDKAGSKSPTKSGPAGGTGGRASGGST